MTAWFIPPRATSDMITMRLRLSGGSAAWAVRYSAKAASTAARFALVTFPFDFTSNVQILRTAPSKAALRSIHADRIETSVVFASLSRSPRVVASAASALSSVARACL